MYSRLKDKRGSKEEGRRSTMSKGRTEDPNLQARGEQVFNSQTPAQKLKIFNEMEKMVKQETVAPPKVDQRSHSGGRKKLIARSSIRSPKNQPHEVLQVKVDLNDSTASPDKMSLLGDDEVQYVMDEVRKRSQSPIAAQQTRAPQV